MNNKPWSFAKFEVLHIEKSLSFVWIYLFQSLILETTTVSGFNRLWVTTDYEESLSVVSTKTGRASALKYPNDQLGFQKYLATTDAGMIRASGHFPGLSDMIRQCNLENRLITEEEFNAAKTLHLLKQ